MRSRLEATAAAWFDHAGIAWAYEPRCFADQRGQYLPDFRLDGLAINGGDARPVYVEVKPTAELARLARAGMEVIWSSEPAADLMVLAPGFADLAIGGDPEGWPTRWEETDVMFIRCGRCQQVGPLSYGGGWVCSRCGKGDKPWTSGGESNLVPLG